MFGFKRKNHAGKSLIQQCAKTQANNVIVATESQNDSKLYDYERCQSVMTASTINNPTHRIAEAALEIEAKDDDVIVCVQGDYPLIKTELIDDLANCLKSNATADMATISTPIKNALDLLSSDVIKVKKDNDHFATNFSRFANTDDVDMLEPSEHIITLDDKFNDEIEEIYQSHRRHIDIWAYRRSLLKAWKSLAQSPLEIIERIEQIRAFTCNKKIFVLEMDVNMQNGIDTIQDLKEAREAAIQ
ncbi:hypothetical protein I3271_00045 [Photobacterium leiognathi]|uniref:cytidylyltransferase domain-containing protein n=1 Tax=Photobacterium leiognathi TaxID=553611 RepID=UPI0030C85E55|nr:hypothetical protein [Photobacterium leiognathi]